MSFLIYDEKLSEKYKANWTKIEVLKNIKLNTLIIYDKRYIKSKVRAYSNKDYAFMV